MVVGASTCGRQVMEVVIVTAAAAMATQTVSTHCLSAVRQRTVKCRGTQKLVPQRSPLRTAVAARHNDK